MKRYHWVSFVFSGKALELAASPASFPQHNIVLPASVGRGFPRSNDVVIESLSRCQLKRFARVELTGRKTLRLGVF